MKQKNKLSSSASGKKITRYFNISVVLCIILTSSMAIKGTAQWSANASINTPVSVALNDQQDHRIAPDGQGGVIIAWTDFRNGTAEADIYAQRIDASGYAKWTVNGIPVCTLAGSNQTMPDIVEDGTGGAIIAWQDWRNGNKDIYIQRIDSSGNIDWAANGQAVVAKANDQQSPRMESDGGSGAIIVWQDSSAGNWDIFAQHTDAAGINVWTSTGIAICNASFNQINPKIETDNNNGAIIIWQDKRSGIDYDLYAQRVNMNGIPQWTTNGAGVCIFSGTQNNPKVKTDGTGGVIIAWTDKRNAGDYDIYAQRLNSSGSAQWTANGVPVCSASGNQSALDITVDFVNGAVIAWKDYRNGIYTDIYAQKIGLSGAAQWTSNGIAVATSSFDQINPDVIGDGAGGAIIAWQDSCCGSWDVKTQRIKSNGSVFWTSGGVAVGSATNNQTSPKQVSDGKNGSLFVFMDKRSGTFDLYAHHLDSLGNPVVASGFLEPDNAIDVFPNPTTGDLRLRIKDLGIENTQVEIYDVLGQDVFKTLILKSNSIIHLNLPSGIYYYQLHGGEKINASGKLIIQ